MDGKMPEQMTAHSYLTVSEDDLIYWHTFMLFTIKMVNGSINKALHAVSHKR